eukprot:CAMPEP_0177765284 /NCGR_PEP_ID=MMETSP0491_2-20121128/7912_1 /TAXON_ID=63592 /ORGANISM="Tetraselmis chuii, Strain PLY429" /LENGTH=216 /DNA_ID=CAMNT_0019281627 /DNA_START=433 /DNA_END=1084 /DNA_ORIENTATION=-
MDIHSGAGASRKHGGRFLDYGAGLQVQGHRNADANQREPKGEVRLVLSSRAREGPTAGEAQVVGGQRGAITWEPDVEVRTIHISSAESPDPVEVKHYLYKDWPDHGTPPSVKDIRSIMDDLESTGANKHPVVIHCSAGIGRTGTFCTIDIILRRLRQVIAQGEQLSEEEINEMSHVKKLVMALRDQRRGMVQTVEQYYFCYQGLHEIVAQLAETGR